MSITERALEERNGRDSASRSNSDISGEYYLDGSGEFRADDRIRASRNATSLRFERATTEQEDIVMRVLISASSPSNYRITRHLRSRAQIPSAKGRPITADLRA